MKRIRSLRTRVILWSLVWAAALYALSHFSVIYLVRQYPHVIRVGHHTLLFIVAFVVFSAGLLGVRGGLAPLKTLRERLGAIREGRARRFEGTYPTEVEPLVDELNALLEERERSVARAVAKAGDLAHGLKTPLAILAQKADHDETIKTQVERMQRQIDYHLAHARAAASGPAHGDRVSVLHAAEALARTLQQLYAGRGLDIVVNIPPNHCIRGQREDLDEMLGNLLDNACKWARSRVTIESTKNDANVIIDVHDDGPGLEPSMRDAVLQRGVRADQALPGSGFGLAIVRDLADLYDGTIALETSPLGGLRARLTLPGC